MTVKELQELHLRSVLGKPLTENERAALDAWYAENDKAESILVKNAAARRGSPELDRELAEVAKKLVAASNHLQKTIDDNDALRKEIAVLKDMLAKKYAESVA